LPTANNAVFVDSAFFIALIREKDENHQRAVELMDSSKGCLLFTSDIVFSEVVTFLQRKDGSRKACAVVGLLLKSDIEILYGGFDDFGEAISLMDNYDFLSFCDALSIVLANRNKTRKILSFDGDFDKIKGIERVY